MGKAGDLKWHIVLTSPENVSPRVGKIYPSVCKFAFKKSAHLTAGIGYSAVREPGRESGPKIFAEIPSVCGGSAEIVRELSGIGTRTA